MVNYFCTKDVWDNCPHRDINDGCANDATKCSYRIAISSYNNRQVVISRAGLNMPSVAQIVRKKNTRQK